MWVICGIIVGKQFNNNDVAVPVIGFKLIDLGTGQLGQISLSEMITNRTENIVKPLNLVDTIERWRRSKRSDLITELCVNNRCMLFRHDKKWVGLYVKLPLFNLDGSFYLFDAPIFRLNNLDEDIGVYMELPRLNFKLIYKGYDIENGRFTGVKSVYKSADKEVKFGLGNSLCLENVNDIKNLWKRDGVIERLGNFICRLECANRFDISILNGITFAELRGCSNTKVTLPPTITKVELLGDTVPENIQLFISKDTDANSVINIVKPFINSPNISNELKTVKNNADLFNLCKKYRLRLVIY